jgi:peptidoglycan/xylan/chitin deacetylase (PgdA/CDA1 family)
MTIRQTLRRAVGQAFRRPAPARPIPGRAPAWGDGWRAALTITFDDARRSQVDVGRPLFQELGIRTTLFVLPDGVDLDRRGWAALVADGHEIGNHTARHPCSANFPWSRDHALEDLALEDMGLEIDEATTWITRTLGLEPRCFAYPCGQTYVGRGAETRSFVPLVADRFLAGRTFNDVALNAPDRCDLAQVQAMNSDALDFEQLRPTLEATLEQGAWLVLGGHEIGDRVDHETTSPATLRAVVSWCRANQVWIGTLGEVAEQVRAVQQAGAAAGSVSP